MLVHYYAQITSIISNIDFRRPYSERCDWIELSKEARGKVDDFSLGVIKKKFISQLSMPSLHERNPRA